MAKSITVNETINAPIQKVWDFYTMPEHIMKWNNASPDWHTPKAENDLRAGGRFLSRMEAKDGSQGFDFTGTYDEVVDKSLIKYTMDGEDKRKVAISMKEENGQTKIEVTFDLENENPEEVQRGGWQSILNNFKSYVEGN
ncbi:MAG: SRPBCC family protein [Candidatus Dojkabacteria bacterium]